MFLNKDLFSVVFTEELIYKISPFCIHMKLKKTKENLTKLDTSLPLVHPCKSDTISF